MEFSWTDLEVYTARAVIIPDQEESGGEHPEVNTKASQSKRRCGARTRLASLLLSSSWASLLKRV
jgi:hypothetical protein